MVTFKRVITETQSKKRIEIVQKNNTQQSSYNLQLSLYDYLRKNNVIKLLDEGANLDEYPIYTLVEEFSLILGSGIKILIEPIYRNLKNKILFTFTSNKDNENKKIQLKRVTHEKIGEKEYQWFVNLYDNNFENSELITSIDLDNKIFFVDSILKVDGVQIDNYSPSKEELQALFHEWTLTFLEKQTFNDNISEDFFKTIDYLFSNGFLDLSYDLTHIKSFDDISSLYDKYVDIEKFDQAYTNGLFRTSYISLYKRFVIQLNINGFFGLKGELKRLSNSSQLSVKEEATNFTNDELVYDFNKSEIESGSNLIVYGTPGSGKSYIINNELMKNVDESNIIRINFYQDYSYTDFIGQIMPVVSNMDKGDNQIASLSYKFIPGPFVLALEKAIEHPNEKVYLIIEEINRGNAQSIFGEIFQLLDRKKEATDIISKGSSIYKVSNIHVQAYLNQKFNYKHYFKYLKIPSNLSIISSMNSSDQNVFTLDSAFKRRFDFLKVPNTFKRIDHNGNKQVHPYKDFFIPGSNPKCTWEKFVNTINNAIVNDENFLNSEDKTLGIYYISKDNLIKQNFDGSDKDIRISFAHKVLDYLWNDIAKFERNSWFASYKTLDDVQNDFIHDFDSLSIFNNGIIDFER